MAGCRDVVMQFAVAYGHIARECMSREELEAKIDSGISPQELTDELSQTNRCHAGDSLGSQYNQPRY